MTSKKLQPLPGFALVKLEGEYESGLSTEREKYASNTKGSLVDLTFINEGNDHVAEELTKYYSGLINSTVYFTPFEDGDIVRHDGGEYVFVPIKQLRGAKLYV